MRKASRLRYIAAVAALALLTSVGIARGSEGLQTRSASPGVVGIRNFTYHPSVLHIKKGTRVVFVNHDGAPHSAIDKGAFNTGVLNPREKATIQFRRAGTFTYVCTFHPGMRGKIVVR